MSSADQIAGGRSAAFEFLDLRDAFPAYVALAVLFAADAALDNALAVGLIVVGAIVGMFATWAYLEAGERGVRRRRARERFEAGLDTTERKARRAAWTVPLGAAIVIAAVASGGLPDGKSFAAAMAIGFLLSQVVFALWLNARHSATSDNTDSGG